MTALLDVNVLIALAWPNHVHHAAARAWFEDRREEGWATCPLTEAGFVRVSCNPSVVRHTVTPLDAIAVLEKLTRLGTHVFLALGPVDRSTAGSNRRPDPGVPSDNGRRLAGRRRAARRTTGHPGWRSRRAGGGEGAPLPMRHSGVKRPGTGLRSCRERG